MYVKPAYVRMLHASPNAPAVDVYANGKLICPELKYGEACHYIEVEAGTVKFQLFAVGTKKNPIYSKNIWIFTRTYNTVAAINMPNDISLFKVTEPEINKYLNRALIRVIHFSPNAPKVDVVLNSGEKLFENIEYKQKTNYLPVMVGKYDFNVNIANTDKTVLQIKDVSVKKDKMYSIYVIGLAGGSPPLSYVLLEDKKR